MTKAIYKVLIGWVFLASIFAVLDAAKLKFDRPSLFPISIFDLGFHSSGLIFALTFLIGLLLSLKYASRIKFFQVWLIALFLVVFGNLTQGGLEKGFIYPVTDKGTGYFYDAIKISSARAWLSEFNNTQADLGTHACTHPPFATLLHFEIMAVTNNQVIPLSVFFTVISSMSIGLMWLIFKILEVPHYNRVLLMILFASIPAFNIYSAVSLEAIILFTSLFFLYGLLRIMIFGLHFQGFVFLLVGIMVTNALTFAGTFLLAVLFVTAIFEYFSKRKWHLLIAFGTTILLGTILMAFLYFGLGYNHQESFFTASRLENPWGFFAFGDPLSYLMTRIEGISEIAIFLSIACLAVFFRRDELKIRLYELREPSNLVFVVSIFVLLLMFLVGSFRTGETARICLFIIPYIFLMYRNLDGNLLINLALVAGAQTILMQLFGYYLW